MAIDFPASPTNGQTYVFNGVTYTYDGTKWKASAGGIGKILQVVNATYSTSTSNSTSTFADTGLTASITPSSSSNKILVIVEQAGVTKSGTGSTENNVALRLLRDSTALITFGGNIGYTNTTLFIDTGNSGCSYLDTPSTTLSVTYKTQFRNPSANFSVTVQHGSGTSTITLLEVAA
jgi:hypothetical protein